MRFYFPTALRLRLVSALAFSYKLIGITVAVIPFLHLAMASAELRSLGSILVYATAPPKPAPSVVTPAMVLEWEILNSPYLQHEIRSDQARVWAQYWNARKRSPCRVPHPVQVDGREHTRTISAEFEHSCRVQAALIAELRKNPIRYCRGGCEKHRETVWPEVLTARRVCEEEFIANRSKIMDEITDFRNPVANTDPLSPAFAALANTVAEKLLCQQTFSPPQPRTIASEVEQYIAKTEFARSYRAQAALIAELLRDTWRTRARQPKEGPMSLPHNSRGLFMQ